MKREMMRESPLLPREFPCLTTGAFILWEIVPSDAADWHRYLSDGRVYEHTSTPIMSLSEVEGLIAMFAEGFHRKTRIRGLSRSGAVRR